MLLFLTIHCRTLMVNGQTATNISPYISSFVRVAQWPLHPTNSMFTVSFLGVGISCEQYVPGVLYVYFFAGHNALVKCAVVDFGIRSVWIHTTG